jgi:hypothetical protein
MPLPRILTLTPLAAALLACAAFEEPASGKSPALIQAPLLHVQWWRTEFYGYDTASYRLRQRPDAPARSELYLDLRYGGSGADYRVVEPSGSEPRPLRVYRHSAERCQVFGSLQSRCLFHDQAGLDLPPELLEQSRASGLTFALRSKAGGTRELALPGDYIEAYLRLLRQPAVKADPAPR